MGTAASGPDWRVTPSCGTATAASPAAGHGSAGVAPVTGVMTGSVRCTATAGKGRPSCTPVTTTTATTSTTATQGQRRWRRRRSGSPTIGVAGGRDSDTGGDRITGTSRDTGGKTVSGDDTDTDSGATSRTAARVPPPTLPGTAAVPLRPNSGTPGPAPSPVAVGESVGREVLMTSPSSASARAPRLCRPRCRTIRSTGRLAARALRAP